MVIENDAANGCQLHNQESVKGKRTEMKVRKKPSKMSRKILLLGQERDVAKRQMSKIK